ncbi:YesL family protein [Enterococcus faecium]|uniref:YesL family protein n=1 Tax=Enterococcus faecium TaxID=1352 RepID=UPI0010B6F531|nr:YesL family protein [Enterococcus faecium]MCD5099337.1 YesL family protein [Enterococcus faecium]MCD5114526.1 YesL family protein [Enterococcus faecium]MCD5216943.1 YesL family protein [Enterococcus faecium]MDT2301603.1 YesL family protein [Enterococcus faecium]BBI26330.1 hypothetical protein EFQU50X_00918 [Enterococcus faecium]
MGKSGNSQAIMDKLSLVADYLLVGVLWLLCSVPLVTTGAATSAMYRTIYQCMFQKEGYVLGTFFKAFKQSFFQSSLIWTGYLVLASSFLLNRQQLAGSYSLLSDAIQIVLGICLLVLLPLVVLVLAYIARFEDPLKIILRNCGLLALTHLGKMIQMLVLYTVVIVGIWLLPVFTLVLLPVVVKKTVPICESLFGFCTIENGS